MSYQVSVLSCHIYYHFPYYLLAANLLQTIPFVITYKPNHLRHQALRPTSLSLTTVLNKLCDVGR